MQTNLNDYTAGGLEAIALNALGAGVSTAQAQVGTSANVSQISSAPKTGIAAVPVWAWYGLAITATFAIVFVAKKIID